MQSEKIKASWQEGRRGLIVAKLNSVDSVKCQINGKCQLKNNRVHKNVNIELNRKYI